MATYTSSFKKLFSPTLVYVGFVYIVIFILLRLFISIFFTFLIHLKSTIYNIVLYKIECLRFAGQFYVICIARRCVFNIRKANVFLCSFLRRLVFLELCLAFWFSIVIDCTFIFTFWWVVNSPSSIHNKDVQHTTSTSVV